MTLGRVLRTTLLAVALLCATAAAQGSVSAGCSLDGASNLPPSDSTSTGNFSVVVDDLRGHFSLEVSNIANLTEVHLHQGTETTPDGGIIVVLIPQLPFPMSVDGSITTLGEFNSTALQGSLAGDDLISLVNLINKNQVYINAHTQVGSTNDALIRGQLAVTDISF